MTWADNHRIISTTELWCSNAHGGTIDVDTDRMNYCPDCGNPLPPTHTDTDHAQ